MCSVSFSGVNPYFNCGGYNCYPTFSGLDEMYMPSYYPTTPCCPPQQYKPKSEKVGFWEGLKAIGKGLLKPIKNMITHPFKSALMIGACAALIIGTGGAATPLLIGAGLAIGGFQVAKGAIVAATADTRQETLAALEDVGEGTFTVGAAVVGAKAWAGSGSATASAASKTGFAKFGAYTKGLAQDSWSAIKAVPSSAQQTIAMVRSGGFAANLQSAAYATKLAAQHRYLARMRQNGLAGTPEYQAAYQNYTAAKAAYQQSGAATKNTIFGEDSLPGYRNIMRKVNIIKNAPEENMALSLSSHLSDDPETMMYAQALLPQYNAAA